MSLKVMRGVFAQIGLTKSLERQEGDLVNTTISVTRKDAIMDILWFVTISALAFRGFYIALQINQVGWWWGEWLPIVGVICFMLSLTRNRVEKLDFSDSLELYKQADRLTTLKLVFVVALALSVFLLYKNPFLQNDVIRSVIPCAVATVYIIAYGFIQDWIEKRIRALKP